MEGRGDGGRSPLPGQHVDQLFPDVRCCLLAPQIPVVPASVGLEVLQGKPTVLMAPSWVSVVHVPSGCPGEDTTPLTPHPPSRKNDNSLMPTLSRILPLKLEILSQGKKQGVSVR